MAAENQRPASDAQPETLIHVCRSAWLAPAAYALYRAILLTFPERGRPLSPHELETLGEHLGIDLEATLHDFARQDLVQRDAITGAISAAYPFSGVPTAHRVHLDPQPRSGGEAVAELYAMCAIDALGVPLMLRRAAWIHSSDAVTGEPLQVRVVPTPEGPLQWSATWEPSGVVVYARPEGHEHEHDCGSSAAGTCCGLTQFFTDEQHATAWSMSHPATDGRIYTQDEALEYAAALFAGILERAGVASPAPMRVRRGPGPQVQLLYFADCPNTPRALEVLREMLQAAGIYTDVELIAVETQEAAERQHFYGSPTIRIDGNDVGPIPSGATPSLSCRLYAQLDGRVAHYASAVTIAAALQQAQAEA